MKRLNNIKIVWYYPHFFLPVGGTKFILEVVSRMAKNYSVSVAGNGGSYALKKNISESGITFIRLNVLATLNPVYWLAFPMMFITELIISLIKVSKNEILIATLFPSNLIAYVVSKVKGNDYYSYCFEPYPYFHSRELIQSFSGLKGIFLKCLSMIYGPLDIIAERGAKKTFTLNEITKKMIAKRYGVQAVVTWMGVDSAHFSPKKIDTILQRRKIVIHSTDYSPMKNTEFAIRIMSLVLEQVPDAVLVITTTQPDNPLKKKLYDLAQNLGISKNIQFLGLLNYDDLARYYASARCYLSCSDNEEFGTSSSNLPVKEALASGIPALRCNITLEDVEDGVSGFLITPSNFNLVAKKIVLLLKDPERAREMGIEGRNKIIKLYNWNTVTQKIIKGIL